jgi:hypothetical protein
MKTALLSNIVILAVPIGGLLDLSNIDPAHKFGWGENIGWTNWQHDTPNPGDGVTVTPTHLSGLVWAQNVGWINLGDGSPTSGVHYANIDASDYGVNLDPDTGDLFGLAWGENVGWINFNTTPVGDDRARFIACDHRFFGYAWGENIGWINLDDATRYVAVGPCETGDYDCDGAVRLDDFSSFEATMTGPGEPPGCPALDADADGDIDMKDFMSFQLAFDEEG